MSPHNEDFSGQTLDGRYRLIRPLARGGMSQIYLGFQESLEREVAIKLLPNAHPRHAATRRFRQEARDICRLTHPHIITYFDYGHTPNGLHYLVMELIEGVSGHHLVYTRKELSLTCLLHVMTQLCAALAEAHRQGITHRDLKWSNVMICHRGEDRYFTKLIDFGVAKVSPHTKNGQQRTQTSLGYVLGTPSYMSPEQAQGFPIDNRSDQYSLGIMLWEAFERRRPFDRANPVATAQAHVSEPLPPFERSAALMRRVPKLAACLRKALSKRVEERFSDITAFKTALVEGLEAAQLVQQETYLYPKVTEAQAKLHAIWSKSSQFEYGPPTPRLPMSHFDLRNVP